MFFLLILPDRLFNSYYFKDFISLFKNFSVDKSQLLCYRSKSQDFGRKKKMLNYCSFEHFVYNIYFHTKNKDGPEFHFPGVFQRKRIIFANVTPEVKKDDSELNTPVNNSCSISAAFGQLRNFISYVKYYNNTGIANSRASHPLKSKDKVTISPSTISSNASKQTLINEQQSSMFKKLVDSRVIRPEAEIDLPLKPLVIKRKVNTMLTRQSQQRQSILFSQRRDSSSKIQLNIARTSQYKINIRRSKRYGIDKLDSQETENSITRRKLSDSELVDLLAEVYQSSSKCVSLKSQNIASYISANKN